MAVIRRREGGRMRAFDIRAKAGKGESVLGMDDLHTHACYMIYGALAPGEKGRLIKPGHGHEEIVLAAKGDFEVTGKFGGTLKEGNAFHITGDAECFLENKTNAEAAYVIAGGHSEGGHGH